MTRSARHELRQRRRRRADSGAALVEFAFVALPLVILVFGIINFGLLLSFKQDMTRAAAEGARAGAVAPVGDAEADAYDETDRAVREFSGRFESQGCKTPGMDDGSGNEDCEVEVADCDGDLTTDGDCVTVTLTYNYQDHPLIPVPVLSALLPDEVKASSVAKVNA